MLVELDIFSGRRNPSWVLGEAQGLELLQLQAQLKRIGLASRDVAGLGYRGFVYSDVNGPVRAYHGTVKTGRAMLKDPAFSIEKLLIKSAPAEFAALGQRVLLELSKL